MGHLLHATHEQSYLALVLAYASCLGIYANETECAAALEPTAQPPPTSTEQPPGGATCPPTSGSDVVQSTVVVPVVWMGLVSALLSR